MGAETSIAWTTHTFNPWIGCTKVSDGCRNCYASAQDHRWGHKRWGPGAPREMTSAANWKLPLRWNREAEAAGERRRVFCASMADVFDAEAPEGARELLFALIRKTPMLDWQLLTKRPEHIAESGLYGTGIAEACPPNVWIGTSVEDQAAADERIPHLVRVPARVRFLSCEPLLGPVDLTHLDCDGAGDKDFCQVNALTGRQTDMGRPCPDVPRIGWVIVGGESGPGARPMRMEWAQSLIDQCKAAGVACFVKQLGVGTSLHTELGRGHHFNDGDRRFIVRDAKGGDPAEWPAQFRVRQFPEVSP